LKQKLQFRCRRNTSGWVGFIDWLDAGLTTTKKLSAILHGTQVFNSGLLDMPLATMFGDMKAVIDVATIGNYCSASASLALKQAAATRQST
jgi:hypothetical protein